MRHFNYSLLLFSTLCFLILGSCIDQDLEDCLPVDKGIRVYFSPKTRNTATGKKITNEEVKDIKLFIFDENGNYVDTEHDATPAFSADYYMTIHLIPGKYSFVAWVNLYSPYSQNEFATLNEMRVYIQENKEHAVLENPHALFQAHEMDVIVTQEENQTIQLSLTRNTNTINVKTVNFVPLEDSYRMMITARNGIYLFDNSFSSDAEEVHYISPMQLGNDSQLTGTQNILRLSRERTDPVLAILSPITGVVVYRAYLMDLIAAINANGTLIDIEHTHVYDIILKFSDPTPNIKVEISINGWIVNNGNAEI